MRKTYRRGHALLHGKCAEVCRVGVLEARVPDHLRCPVTCSEIRANEDPSVYLMLRPVHGGDEPAEFPNVIIWAICARAVSVTKVEIGFVAGLQTDEVVAEDALPVVSDPELVRAQVKPWYTCHQQKQLSY